MKLNSLLAFAILTPVIAFAQGPPSASLPESAPGAFQITKITKNLITAPQFNYSGAERYATNQRDRWLEVQVEFTASQFTDELTCKYYILFNGTLLTGDVTHVNIPAGRENRSVMYVPPRALERFANNRPITDNLFQNVAVQIAQAGAVKAEASLARAQPQWFATLQAAPSGFVLNKNQTPFAPLYWDRYEQIKAAP
ncbi:MAG: hypothetical protein DME91_03860 [Verrucomicrobia bacterium]|nr:MAG: hypothetical protein DME91_03860 [Verrucomicrobiota bacterium]